MASSLRYPTSAVSAASGDVDWGGTLGNLYADDTAYAESYSFPDSGNITTDEIDVTGFGFSIPSTATIDGITVTIHRKGSVLLDAAVVDNLVQLRKSTGLVGNNKADTVSGWSTSFTNAVYGSSSDLWGTTWTPTEINNSSFGVRFQALEITAEDYGAYPIIDFFTIEVFYTESGGGTDTAKMMMMFD